MSETKFSVMVSLFNWMQKSKSSSVKRSKFRKFLDTFCRPKNGDDYFSAIRLILPSLDRERGSYGLREHVLATCLIDALGMSRDSPDSQRLLNWRKGGPKSGTFAGNFSLVAAEVLQRRQAMTSGNLTIKELNDLLDRLASSENRPEKISILSDLIRKTNAQEMKWIIMIILKDLKLGISEKSIFHEFHPDAEDLFNVTCDLKLVCEKLRDRSQRHKRQDIEVGKPVRPQLALRVSNAAAAWKKLHGKEVVVECKFDGDRIQIHKNGAEINFFSRNFLGHPEYEHGMSDVIRENILADRCILDGEMLVWDKYANRFAEFGSNQEIGSDILFGPMLSAIYVAFDILYVGDTSVIHQSLKERHQLLRKIVRPVSGRLEILVPNGGLNAHRPAGEPCWSLVVYDVDSVERFFKETIENRDEGIVLKDLGSKWEPSDRSGKWLKLKPDYIRAGSDLDVLIIGGYYGSGRRGGEVAQFLVGLAERQAPNAFPRRFVSFCRVGTGLSDEELNVLVTKLKPYLRKSEYPKKAPPSFYQVTNNSKERPDVWVESPEKSIIVSITSDIRTIRSEVFAAPYSLRFPRIDRVRYDKPWHECLDVQSFVELVHSSNGSTQRANDNEAVHEHKPKRAKVLRGTKKNVSIVPSHFIQTDVSHVKGETSIFSNLVFYFANIPSSCSLDSLHKMVAENGGTFSMNLNNSVTHCIASESRGLKFQAAKRQGDVIHYSWFADCCAQKKLLPLQPRYFLCLSDMTKEKLGEEIDKFSDSYFLDLNVTDLKQIFSSMGKVEDSKGKEYYKKKYSPREDWVRFHGCRVYFHLHGKNRNLDIPLELAMRRMKIEIRSGGGSVSDTLSCATHLVVVALPQTDVDFNALMNSFSEVDKHLLGRRNLQIVKSQWLDDCFDKDRKLPEDRYSLIPEGFQMTSTGEGAEFEDNPKEHHSSGFGSRDSLSSYKDGKKGITSEVKPRLVSLPNNRSGNRKRGRPIGSSTKGGKQAVNKSRRTRSRVGHKPAKINENESDQDTSLDNGKDSEANEVVEEIKRMSDQNRPRRTRARIIHKPPVIVGDDVDLEVLEDKQKEHLPSGTANGPETQTNEAVKDSTSEGKALDEIKDHSEYGQKFDKINDVTGRQGCSSSSTQYKGRVEDDIDPLEAMLLNMVPMLAKTAVGSSNPVHVDVEHKCLDPKPEEGKSSSDADTQLVKKPKVSFRDLAKELLEEW
ncbi:DNA ligase 4 [Striga hermonthica]|uniref:DNA ligase n=1 Tax=Striga hermonthica TaxID=68872 RepID=A0A9N7N6D8_STRHE|nr:DNA ligase 4 [Striga hermonthica]